MHLCLAIWSKMDHDRDISVHWEPNYWHGATLICVLLTIQRSRALCQSASLGIAASGKAYSKLQWLYNIATPKGCMAGLPVIGMMSGVRQIELHPLR